MMGIHGGCGMGVARGRRIGIVEISIFLSLVLWRQTACGRLVLSRRRQFESGEEAGGGGIDRRNARLTEGNVSGNSTKSYYTIADYKTSVQEKRVTSLPGFNRKTTPSAHFAGYVHLTPKTTPKRENENGTNSTGSSVVTTTKSLFYYFVESERSPSIDPVVLWLNGGPGCSSMYGFALGHGPFRFRKPINTSSSTLPTLSVNRYAWSKVANMLYVDSPFGVGLSLGPVGDRPAYEPILTDDWQTSADLHAFLLAWVGAHPRFANNPLYLSGESYAGVYVPMLAMNVLEGVDEKLRPILNLKGYLIGNGVAEAQDTLGFDSFGRVEAPHGLSLINEEMYGWITSECGSREQMANPWRASDLCRAALQEASAVFLNYLTVKKIDVYNTLGPCDNDLPLSLQALEEYYRGLWLEKEKENATGAVATWGDLGEGTKLTKMAVISEPIFRSQQFFCEDDSWLGSWFNNAQVRAAINVRPVSEIGNWTTCAESEKLAYTSNGGNMVPLHRIATSKYGLRVLVYSGDHDLVVPTPGTEAWLRYLGYGEATPGSLIWEKWTEAGGRTAGFRQFFEKNLTFITVIGAGHATPKDKPAASLQFFRSWIDKSGVFTQ